MYYLIFIACIVSMFLAKKEQKKTFLMISFIVLFVFSALRYNFGNDYSSYNIYFNEVKAGVTSLSINEKGYYIINKITPNFCLLLAIISGGFLFTLYKLVTKYLDPEEYPFSLLILLIDPYMFLMSLSMVRQSIAIIFFIVAIYFAQKKKYLLYILICVIASFFHLSAILLIVFIFFANNRRDFLTNPWVCLSVVFVLLFFCSTLIFPFIEKVLEYLNNPNYIYYYQNVPTNSLRATILSSVSMVYVVFNIRKLDDKRIMYGKLSLFSYFSDLFAYKIAMVGRIGIYFSFFRLISLPAIFIYNLKNAKGADRLINVYIFPLLILIIYLLRLYTFFTNSMWEPFREYHTIFSLL